MNIASYYNQSNLISAGFFNQQKRRVSSTSGGFNGNFVPNNDSMDYQYNRVMNTATTEEEDLNQNEEEDMKSEDYQAN